MSSATKFTSSTPASYHAAANSSTTVGTAELFLEVLAENYKNVFDATVAETSAPAPTAPLINVPTTLAVQAPSRQSNGVYVDSGMRYLEAMAAQYQEVYNQTVPKE